MELSFFVIESLSTITSTKFVQKLCELNKANIWGSRKQTGSYRAIWNHKRPHRTIQDHMEQQGIIRDYMVYMGPYSSYRNIWDYTVPLGTIRGHKDIY